MRLCLLLARLRIPFGCNLVELHGGRFVLESTADRGATARVALPASVPAG
jgi:hypothetical protein